MKVRRIAALSSVVLLVACATEPARTPAPIVERTKPAGGASAESTPAAPPTRPAVAEISGKSYTVKPGDTLYSIALENGLDYKEIAAWNQLPDVNLIKIGQVLRLSDPSEATAPDSAGVVVRPLKAQGESPAPASTPSAAGATTISYPKALKLPYNTDAATVAKQAEGLSQSAAAPSKPADTASANPAAPAKPVQDTGSSAASNEEEDIAWAWPVTGKVISSFSDTSKGIDIGGKQGQPVLAAAAGRVVYAGSGLRGYGQLIIIKHNKTYLSAYAHNSQLLVKEGDNVKKGDKIAEMGKTDADQVKLHFEIRRFGKPIDPTKLLTTAG